MASKTKAAAQDATVETDHMTLGSYGSRTGDPVDERTVNKARAALEYYRRELAAAEEAVKRLEGKADKLRAHAEDADAALDEARAEATAAADRLSNWESYVETLGGDR